MIKQFANYIKIIPANHVDSISAGEVNLKTGKAFDEFISLNTAVLTDTPGNNNGNAVYKQSSNVEVAALTTVQKSRYKLPRPVIVVFFIENTSVPVVVGSIDNPAMVSVRPMADRYDIEIQRTSKFAVLF